MRITLMLFTIYLFSCSPKPEKPLPAKKKDTLAFYPKTEKQELQIDTSLVVYDTITKLWWMKQDFSFIKKRFLNEWKEVFEWRDELNASHYAGFSDWQVPDVSQYRSIDNSEQDRIDYKRKFIELDSACVWGRGPYSFWSSTTPNENTASYISFIDGFATSGSRKKNFSNPYSSWKGVELGMSVRLVKLSRYRSL